MRFVAVMPPVESDTAPKGVVCFLVSLLSAPMRLGDALVTPRSDATYRPSDARHGLTTSTCFGGRVCRASRPSQVAPGFCELRSSGGCHCQIKSLSQGAHSKVRTGGWTCAFARTCTSRIGRPHFGHLGGEK
jgi:hypothetical protein